MPVMLLNVAVAPSVTCKKKKPLCSLSDSSCFLFFLFLTPSTLSSPEENKRTRLTIEGDWIDWNNAVS